MLREAQRYAGAKQHSRKRALCLSAGQVNGFKTVSRFSKT